MSDMVKIIECPRDAWQGLQGQIPTDLKVDYLKALLSAGFKNIDAASFVSAKAVPQMADSADVLRELDLSEDVEIIAIVVNEKGAQRAIETGKVRTLGFPYSVSPTFLYNNQRQTPEESLEQLESIQKKADDASLEVVAYISMAFGNPYGDQWSDRRVADLAQQITEVGVRTISLADTAGVSDPRRIDELVATLMKTCPDSEIGVHLHSAPGDVVAKVLAAYDAGCRRFDSALGGLGGCPFAQDKLLGNIPTESVISALAQRGIKLPMQAQLEAALAMNGAIGSEYSG